MEKLNSLEWYNEIKRGDSLKQYASGNQFGWQSGYYFFYDYIKKRTDKAILFVGCGTEKWIPISVILEEGSTEIEYDENRLASCPKMKRMKCCKRVVVKRNYFTRVSLDKTFMIDMGFTMSGDHIYDKNKISCDEGYDRMETAYGYPIDDILPEEF